MYFVQSNTPNEWLSALDSQIEIMNQCREKKSNVNFVITDPKSNKSFNSMCKYVDNDNFEFENQETGVLRRAFFCASKPDSFPEHGGIS